MIFEFWNVNYPLTKYFSNQVQKSSEVRCFDSLINFWYPLPLIRLTVNQFPLLWNTTRNIIWNRNKVSLYALEQCCSNIKCYVSKPLTLIKNQSSLVVRASMLSSKITIPKIKAIYEVKEGYQIWLFDRALHLFTRVPFPTLNHHYLI